MVVEENPGKTIIEYSKAANQMRIHCNNAFTPLVIALTECLEYGLISNSDDAVLSLFECACNGSEEFQEIDKEVKSCNTV